MWRDRIKVHPAAALFPMMSDGELQELAADIRENGLRNGVVLWTPEKAGEVGPRKGPGELYLLDGRNRLEAIERAYPDGAEREEAISCALYIDPQQDGAAHLVFGDEDPHAYVVSANIHRRHLTVEKKREVIAALLKAMPERSDNATAKIAQVSHNTVASVRRALEEGGEVVKLTTRTGADGVQQPAEKPPPSKEEQLRRMRERQMRQQMSASEKRVEAGVNAVKKLSAEELDVFDDWYRAYREDGGAVFDKTKVGHALMGAA